MKENCFRKSLTCGIFLMLFFVAFTALPVHVSAEEEYFTTVYGTVFYGDGMTPLDCAPADSLMIEVRNPEAFPPEDPLGTWCTQPDINGYYSMEVYWTCVYNEILVTYCDDVYHGCSIDVADNMGPGDTYIDVITNMPVPDITPPETTISLDGVLAPDGWYISDVTVTLSATDDMSGVSRRGSNRG